ncbi:MAG: Carbonic anhydrase, beta class [uncultured Rubrobacteraceae bacterium]|uniref:carbonic anhydrase n=1 Tax=uncultured Rubrobacteraceae bacterium TaxID=349277 RepID=A0A6J4SU30_9ACTN|nr:MAG: Carbonic anhydrase, beta class [uncultured Rubrobacteraceae bacterium]
MKKAEPTNIDALLGRNRAFAAAGGHEGVPVMPRRRVFLITCLDPRVEPAGFLGMEPGDAMVVRNAGGRVTPEVLLDLAFIGALAERQVPEGPLFEVAVVHHTDCGTGILADERFRRGFAARTGVGEAALAEQAVIEPELTVREDVERVRACPWLSDRVNVSGYVYDLGPGLVRTVVGASPVGSPAPTGGVA